MQKLPYELTQKMATRKFQGLIITDCCIMIRYCSVELSGLHNLCWIKPSKKSIITIPIFPFYNHNHFPFLSKPFVKFMQVLLPISYHFKLFNFLHTLVILNNNSLYILNLQHHHIHAIQQHTILTSIQCYESLHIYQVFLILRFDRSKDRQALPT